MSSIPPEISDWRFNPFTESYQAVQITDEDRQIPSSSPYQVRLYEVPRKDSPSTVDIVILVELDEDLDTSETDVDILAAHYARVQVGDVLLCDSEKMYVSSKPGSPTLGVTRGYGGTTPATHTDGTKMEILVSMTEKTSGSPATREFRVDYKYNTGLVLFNSAQAGYDIRCDYWGLGTPLSISEGGWLTSQMRPYVKGDIPHPWAVCDATDSVTPTAYTKYKEMRLDRYAKSLRIKFEIRTTDAGGTIYGKIYKNGVAIGTEQSTTSQTFQLKSEDFDTFVPGDLIQLYCRRENYDGEARNLALYIDEDLTPYIVDD